MDLKLNGRIALVTGVASQIGYGKGIALTLAKEGCDIVGADIDLEGARKTTDEIEGLGRRALAIKVDVTDRASVDAMVKTALTAFGAIDILVNNAGATSGNRPFVETSSENWDTDIKVNLYGQMNVAHAVLPHMIERKYGRIVNTSGGIGFPTISTYGAAKAGVVAFTRSLAREVASLGIFVNAVGPGLALTGLVEGAPQEFLDFVVQTTALKRFCTPEDLAPVVAFLASDVCSYMIGQCINLADT